MTGKNTLSGVRRSIDLARDLKTCYSTHMKWTAKQLRVLRQHESCHHDVRTQGNHVGIWCATHDIRIRWIPREHEQKVREWISSGK